MAEQLKVIIDADVSKAERGIESVTKSIASDFTKATNLANTAATELSSQIVTSVQKINTAFDSVKAPSFGVLGFDTSKALADVQKFKTELSSVSVKPISVPINIPPVPPSTLKSINELETELDELRTKINFSKNVEEIRRLGDEFKKVQGQINNIKVVGGLDTSLNKIGTSSKQAIDNLKKVPGASNTATFALTNLGRVAQDLPFGFIGIANNLNPLLESFQRVRAESRTFGATIKALGVSLIGAGGLGLAVSVLSGVFSSLALNSRSAKKEVEETAKASDVAAAKQKEFTDAIDKAASSLLNQTDKLKDLNKVLTTTKLSIDDITDSTIKQGLAQFVFDKKNVELQKLLNAEIQKEIKLRNQKDIRTTVPEFDTGIISKNPLERQAAQAREQIGLLNFLGLGLEGFFKKFVKTNNDLAKEMDKTISLARQFVKEFGNAFVVPDLDESFFVGKDEIFKRAKKLLDDVSKNNLKIKIPIETEIVEKKIDVNLVEKGISVSLKNIKPEIQKIVIPVVTDVDINLAESLAKEFEPTQALIDNFFKGVAIEKNIPVKVTPDLSLEKASTDKILKKLDLRKQFSILGNVGTKEFNKIFDQFKGLKFNEISFAKFDKALEEGNKLFSNMIALANTLQQSIGQGLTGAFDAMFDAILEGKNVFKALGEALKGLIVNTIKAIAQMLILKFVTNLIFPGAGAAGSISKGLGGGFFNLLPGQVNGGNSFGLAGQIAGRSFNNVININVQGQLSGQDILLSGQRAFNSQGR